MIFFQLLVREIQVADRSSNLSPKLFLSDSTLLGPKYEHHVFTNGHSYRVSGVQLIRLDQAHNKILTPDHPVKPGHRLWALILLASTLFLLPVIFLATRKK